VSSPGSPRLPEAEGDSRPFGAPHQSIVPMCSPLPTWRRCRFYCKPLLKVPLARDDGVIDAPAPGAAKIAPPAFPLKQTTRSENSRPMSGCFRLIRILQIDSMRP
jgi:hypothetical protein